MKERKINKMPAKWPQTGQIDKRTTSANELKRQNAIRTKHNVTYIGKDTGTRPSGGISCFCPTFVLFLAFFPSMDFFYHRLSVGRAESVRIQIFPNFVPILKLFKILKVSESGSVRIFKILKVSELESVRIFKILKGISKSESVRFIQSWMMYDSYIWKLS